MQFESYDYKLHAMKAAMTRDSLNNEEKHETGRVSVQDVSDCPELMAHPATWERPFDFETCEDMFEDLAYEMLMTEMNQFRMKHDLAAA